MAPLEDDSLLEQSSGGGGGRACRGGELRKNGMTPGRGWTYEGEIGIVPGL
jgi:hypothetical protein